LKTLQDYNKCHLNII